MHQNEYLIEVFGFIQYILVFLFIG